MEIDDDPFDILGVSPDAASIEIKFAFRKMAIEFHPDKQETQEDKEAASAIFAKISHAYETVSDPDKLAQWNARQARQNTSSSHRSSGSLRGSSHGSRPMGRSMQSGGGRGGLGGSSSHGSSHRSSHGHSGKTSSSQHRHHPSYDRQGPPRRSSDRNSRPTSHDGVKVADPSPLIYYPTTKQYNRSDIRSTGATGKRRSSSSEPAPKTYSDPFKLFDQVMKEEFGRDYKERQAWKGTQGAKNLGSINPFKKKNEDSCKEFRKLDVDGDRTLSKSELSKYIMSHKELWKTLSKSLELPFDKCIYVATNVAFALALKKEDAMNTVRDRDLTEKEFKYFHQTYILNEKGANEFFLRTIFNVFDVNHDGVLSRKELDRFLDIFYKSYEFRGSKRLPDRKTLNDAVHRKCDLNNDGELGFNEVKDLLVLAAVVTADK